MDVAGNIAVASQVKNFAIDNSGALMPDGTHDPLGDQGIAIVSITNDTGVSGSDFITNATHVDAHGTGFANAWIQVFLDDKYLGNRQIDGSGNWTYGLDTPQGNHTIRAHYIDLAENVVPGPGASHGMTVDTTAPTLQIQLPAGTAKGAETVYFNFSEGVSGFDASDVALSNATLSGFTKIDDAHYSATVTPPGKGSGTFSLSVANDVYVDTAGNGGTGDSQSQAYKNGRVNLFGDGDFANLAGWTSPISYGSYNSTLTGGFFADSIHNVNGQGAIRVDSSARFSIHLEQGKSYDFSIDMIDLNVGGPGESIFIYNLRDLAGNRIEDPWYGGIILSRPTDKIIGSGAWTTDKSGPWQWKGVTGEYIFSFETALNDHVVLADRAFFGEVVI